MHKTKQAQAAKHTLSHLTHVMEKMHQGMERKYLGGELQLLKHLVKALKTVTGSLSLPMTGSAPLFLGLSAAANGIYSETSATGIVGPSMAKLMHSLTDGLITGLMPEADTARCRMLALSIMTVYTIAACLALKTVEQGIGRFSEEMELEDLKSARFFTFELLLFLLNSYGGFEEAFKVLIEACGGGARAQAVGAPLLAQIGHLLMVFSAARGKRQAAADIFGEHAEYFGRGLAAAEEIMINQHNTSYASNAAGVALKQLKLALDEKNFEGCMEIIDSLLENLGTSGEALLSDIERIRKTVQMISEITSQESQEPLTGIVQSI